MKKESDMMLTRVRFFFFAFLMSFLLVGAVKGTGGRYAAGSVLSRGIWQKIEVEQTGIYKITYSDLRKMGFTDPSKVAIYGYGGWPLEEDFTKPYVDDLPEIPVYREDNFLLFYARGCVRWDFETFGHVNNPYSNRGYYFMTEKDMPKTMETADMERVEGTLRITSFDDCILHEKDLVSLSESGKELFDYSFYKSMKTIPMGNLESLGVTEEPITAECRFLSRTLTANEASLFVSKQLIDSRNVPLSHGYNPSLDIYIKARAVFLKGTYQHPSPGALDIDITYKDKGNNAAWIDYVKLILKRELKSYGSPFLFFRNLKSKENDANYRIEGADEAMYVWDVTDYLNPVLVPAKLEGSLLSFSARGGKLREFALVKVDHASFPSPNYIGEVPNQDLHAMTAAEMVIIAPFGLKSQAERLKNIHYEKEGLTVAVVTPEEIYNEFSSGTPDATAYRRFMKMFYDRSATEAPRYLLLFGNGTYDNRFLTTNWNTTSDYVRSNMLLTYQSDESLEFGTYASDDYFGLLDDTDVRGGSLEGGSLDLGIGRLPVRTYEDAKYMVDKIEAYMNNTLRGIWKNRVTFVADDGGNKDTDKNYHMRDADELANLFKDKYPGFLVDKIYFDTYKKENGMAYPDVEKRIRQNLNDGVMLINYTGHGNTTSWADEYVLTQSSIQSFTYPQLPLWITATCDFVRFDALTASGGESVVMNRTSGGIGVFGACRAAIGSSNRDINEYFLKSMLDDELSGKIVRLGDAVRSSKDSCKDDRNKQFFLLLGDPALRLSAPTHRILVRTVNGRPVGEEDVWLKAFERVTIEGEVVKPDGTRMDAFNGEMEMEVFEGPSDITTLDNFHTGKPFRYEAYQNPIYRGMDVVKDGVFRVSFIIPKDITYSNVKNGRMSLYAFDNSLAVEAQGYFHDFVVRGTSDNPEHDEDPPVITQLFLNDSTFTDGGQVNATPFFYARVWDKTGINITGGSLGHDVTLSIDNTPYCTYSLNACYNKIAGADGEGEVCFSVPKLPGGFHEAEFKVWDIMNNSATRTFRFEVVEGLKPVMFNLTATPSPAKEQVVFQFSHDRPGSQMNVGIQVYDLAGRLIWSHDESGASDVFKVYRVSWNLTDQSGRRVKPGIYLYRAVISDGYSKEAMEAEKLIVL